MVIHSRSVVCECVVSMIHILCAIGHAHVSVRAANVLRMMGRTRACMRGVQADIETSDTHAARPDPALAIAAR